MASHAENWPIAFPERSPWLKKSCRESVLRQSTRHPRNQLVQNLQEVIINHIKPLLFPIFHFPWMFHTFPVGFSRFPGDLPQRLRGSPWRTALSLLRELPENRTTPEAAQWRWGGDGDGGSPQKKKIVFDRFD